MNFFLRLRPILPCFLFVSNSHSLRLRVEMKIHCESDRFISSVEDELFFSTSSFDRLGIQTGIWNMDWNFDYEPNWIFIWVSSSEFASWNLGTRVQFAKVKLWILDRLNRLRLYWKFSTWIRNLDWESVFISSFKFQVKTYLKNGFENHLAADLVWVNPPHELKKK